MDSQSLEHTEGQDPLDPNKGLMRTYTGKTVNPLALTDEMIDIRDIAHSLSKIARFNGHHHGFNSVGEHSVYVSMICYKYPMEGLLHDAAEAYLGDMIRPLKNLPAFLAFRHADENCEKAIARRFGLTYPWPKEVHDADNARLLAEIQHFNNPQFSTTPPHAEHLFLTRFRELGGTL